MQTFLPYRSFDWSARCIDPQRGRKQIIEAKQCLIGLLGGSFVVYDRQLIKVSDGGFPHHPCLDMWRGYEQALCEYGVAFHERHAGNGYRFARYLFDSILEIDKPTRYPAWLGNRRFHNSHRSNLLRKNESHYSQFNWSVPLDLDYVWPKGENS